MSYDTVRVRLPDGTIMLVAVANQIKEKEVALRDYDFSSVLSTITSLSTSLLEAVKAAKPKKASLEFTLELSAEAGQLTALLVKGGGKGIVKVALEWS